MTRYHVEHLEPGTSVPAAVVADVFRAAWRGIEVIDVAPGEVFGDRVLADSEAMVYVLAGTGTARLQHAPVELRTGIALTLFGGERLELEAGPDSLRAFVAEVATERAAVRA